jgi:hypothetical protein
MLTFIADWFYVLDSQNRPLTEREMIRNLQVIINDASTLPTNVAQRAVGLNIAFFLANCTLNLRLRLEFYANHNIGWVARPRHSSAPGSFKRAGKFKKASNMNYGLNLSIAMEQQLAKLIADAQPVPASSPNSSPALHNPGEPQEPGLSSPPNYENIDVLEERALQLAIEQVYQESGTVKKVVDESGKETEEVIYHRPWAGGVRSLRVGEIILIIDADTVVPEDCFRDAAREMGEEGGEEVAIIQHESGAYSFSGPL